MNEHRVDGAMTLVLDDGIPTVLLIEELNALGLTISNVGGFHFRLHPLKSTEDVIARLQRRRDARTDQQIRAAFRQLVIESFRGLPTQWPHGPPPPRDVTGRTPPPPPPSAA